ncbi:MAG: hypothetical protein LBB05_02845 [Puniceicoccales bacterium]|jgi:hypothetical protein|nr:hypothetical protein [Puniceicoccales bacterium]
MKWVHTLVLMVIILALCVLNWQLCRITDPGEAKNLSHNVWDWEQKICKICITFQGERIELEKKDHNRWQLTKHFHWAVNPFAVKEFFRAFSAEKVMPEHTVIIFERKDGTQMTFASNDAEEDDHFCETALMRILKQGIHFWCERSICPLKLWEICQLDLIFHRTQQKFSLVKKGNRWDFLSPIAIEANTMAVEKFLEHIIAWEVFPFKNEKLQKDGNGCIYFESAMAKEKKFEITMIIGDMRQQQLSIHLKKKVFDSVSKRDVYLGCLSGSEAYFFVPLNDVWDHPLQSLFHRSLFPEIHSIALRYRGEKLFLSRNEAGKWNAFKLLEKETALHLLENFDEKAVLLCLSLIQPLDVKEKSALNVEWDGEKLILEINETLKFELGVIKSETYLVPVDKNYALKIENNSLSELIEILEKE